MFECGRRLIVELLFGKSEYLYKTNVLMVAAVVGFVTFFRTFRFGECRFLRDVYPMSAVFLQPRSGKNTTTNFIIRQYTILLSLFTNSKVRARYWVSSTVCVCVRVCVCVLLSMSLLQLLMWL
jgi:hypothetical protein